MNQMPQNGLLMEGVIGSQAIDTTGEILDIAGCDIDALKEGKGLINTEHISPKDIEKSSTEDDFKGFQTIVGRVLSAKKIFSEKDCETEKELNAWNHIKKPLIYGKMVIWDGPDAPENAKALAAIVRMLKKENADFKLGLSVEGQTLKREGNLLKETVVRNVAATIKPANRTALIDIVENSTPQAPNTVKKAAVVGSHEFLSKSVNLMDFNLTEPQKDFGFSDSLKKLKQLVGKNKAKDLLKFEKETSIIYDFLKKGQ